MGIRIHKVLGYGLVDVKTKSGKIIDKRFNPDCHLVDKTKEEDLGNSKEKYLKYCEENLNNVSDSYDIKWEIKHLNDSNWDVYDSITYQSEFGLPNVLCFTPAHYQKHWKRYDDILDMYQESAITNKTRNYCASRIDLIDGSIYPYIGTYIDKRTGSIVKDGIDFIQINNFVLDRKKIQRKKRIKDNCAIDLQMQNRLHEVALKLGFESEESAFENLRAKQPDSVVALFKCFEIFEDESTIRDLIPILYTYWS